jgi:hypothetical protein
VFFFWWFLFSPFSLHELPINKSAAQVNCVMSNFPLHCKCYAGITLLISFKHSKNETWCTNHNIISVNGSVVTSAVDAAVLQVK